MMKYKIMTVILCLMVFTGTHGQNKYEREYRIKKNQFPRQAHSFMEIYLSKARKLKYYKEKDSAKTSYAAKFKLDRLRYSAKFNSNGQFEAMKILIKEVDIPNASFANMNQFLDETFSKHRILKLQQLYSASKNETVKETVKNAVQNLLLPSVRYEMMITAKKDKGFEDYEILFDAEGNYINMRKSLPLNYDHILY